MAFIDEIVKPGVQIVPLVRIDGYPWWYIMRTGPAAADMPPWAFPAGDGLGIRDGLWVPPELSQSVDQKQAISDVSNLKIKITAPTDDDTPIRVGGPNANFARTFGAPARPFADTSVFTTFLAADVEAGDVTIDLVDNAGIPGFPFLLAVGNETMNVTGGGPITHNVTRFLYPCVVGGDIPQQHKIDPDGEVSTYMVSEIPSETYNRAIALYFTWRDENGNWGGKGEIHLRWVGRMKAPRELPNETDTWEIDCAPITRDLGKQIFTTTAAQANVAVGIEFRGLQSVYRTIYVEVADDIDLPGPRREYYVVIAEEFYPTFHALIESINAQLEADMQFGDAAGDDGFVLFGTTTDGTGGQPRVRLVWDRLGTDADFLHMNLPSPIADVLGFDADRRITVNALGAGAWDNIEFPMAQATPALFYWDRMCDRLRLVDAPTDPAFTVGLMGDGSANPAVKVGDFAVMRYTGTIGNNLVIPQWTARSNNTTYIGSDKMLIRIDDEWEPMVVRQVYLMPRTFGAGDVSDTGIFRHLLYLMLSTGDPGTNGGFDVYPDRHYGLGIPAVYVDGASFLAAEALIDGALQERQWCIEEPTSLIEIIEAEAAVLGFHVIMTNDGRIGIAIPRTALGGIDHDVALNEFNKVDVPGRVDGSRPAAGLFNSGTIKFNFPIAQEPIASITFNFGDPESQSRYGEQRGMDIEHHGLFAFDGSAGIDMLLEGMAGRIGLMSTPRTRVVRGIDHTIFGRLQVADFVGLTDSHLRDVETGLHGVKDATFTVLELSENWQARTGSVTLVRDSVIPSSMVTPVDPSALVTAGTAPAVILTLAANEFTFAALGDEDRDYFRAGDLVEFTEGDAADPAAAIAPEVRTITAIGPGANQITINAAFVALDPATDIVYMSFREALAIAGTSDQASRATWSGGRDMRINHSDADYLAHRYTS